MYEFYEKPPKLNMKKVAAISIIFVLIVICMIFAIVKKVSTKKEVATNEIKESSTIFYSNDKSICVELDNNLNLVNYNSDLDYLLELRSSDNLNIFISSENSIPGRELSDIIEADKIAFLNRFDKYSNLSNTKELSVNNNTAYTYSFHYLDQQLNTAFYLQIVWLQINDTYYIFDIEFPLDDLSFNTNIATSVLSTFQKL